MRDAGELVSRFGKYYCAWTIFMALIYALTNDQVEKRTKAVLYHNIWKIVGVKWKTRERLEL